MLAESRNALAFLRVTLPGNDIYLTDLEPYATKGLSQGMLLPFFGGHARSVFVFTEIMSPDPTINHSASGKGAGAVRSNPAIPTISNA